MDEKRKDRCDTAMFWTIVSTFLHIPHFAFIVAFSMAFSVNKMPSILSNILLFILIVLSMGLPYPVSSVFAIIGAVFNIFGIVFSCFNLICKTKKICIWSWIFLMINGVSLFLSLKFFDLLIMGL